MARPRGYKLNRWALDDAMKAGPYTATEIAAAIKRSPSVLSDLRIDRQRASAQTAQALATALNVDARTLFPALAGFGDDLVAAVA